MKKKTFIYHDPVNDDFANTGFSYKPLPENLKWYHGKVYRFFSLVVYYVLLIPIFFLFGKLFYGYKIRGRKKLRKSHFFLRRESYFLYGNHTNISDAYLPVVGICAPKKAYIVCGQESVSIPFLRPIEMFIGAYPLPETKEQKERYLEGMEKHLSHGSVFLIFPEAHIWPYYTKIRPFPDASFTYPAQFGKPVIAFCTTYKKRKIMKWRAPKPTFHVSGPFYPDMSKSLGERAHLLRQQVYDFMVETSCSWDNDETHVYIDGRKEENNR